MEFLLDLTSRASEYPKHHTFGDVHPYLLDFYFEQLNKFERKLFDDINGASVSFWECSCGGRCKFVHD